MFAYPRNLFALTAALALLFVVGCAGDEPPGSAPPESLDAVADGFVGLKGDSEGAPRWTDPVTVYVGGEVAKKLAAAEADERSSWSTCPPSATEYAMRKCPVSPFRTMDLLAQDGGTVVYEDKVPTRLGCDLVAALPEWETLGTITIRPDLAHQNCFSDFAITLYVDDRNRINAVNFTLGSP